MLTPAEQEQFRAFIREARAYAEAWVKGNPENLKPPKPFRCDKQQERSPLVAKDGIKRNVP